MFLFLKNMLVEQQITGLRTLTFAAPSLIPEPSLLPKNAFQCFSGQVPSLQNSVKEAGWVDMEGEFRILLSYGKSERMPAHSSVGPAKLHDRSHETEIQPNSQETLL